MPRAENYALADACVLLNLVCPLSFYVGDPVIETQYECLHSSIAYKSKLSVDSDNYWLKLKRNWVHTTRLAVTLYENGYKFNNTKSTFESISTLFETWVRGIWYMHSPDGHSPPDAGPFRGRLSPRHIRSTDVNAVFVDNKQSVDENARLQRGAAFGIQTLQLNQVFQAMNCATHIPNICVQVYRNEGCLLIRPSSFALKRASGGEPPSAKSISPVQSENDAQAFGSRKAKEDCSRRQMHSWSMNNEIIFAFTSKFSAPLAAAVTTRGSSRRVESSRELLAALRSEGRCSQQEKDAECTVRNAARHAV